MSDIFYFLHLHRTPVKCRNIADIDVGIGILGELLDHED